VVARIVQFEVVRRWLADVDDRGQVLYELVDVL